MASYAPTERPSPLYGTQGSAKPPPWVCVGFEGGFGPKGLRNSAQALAWVALFLRASPVRAPDNAGAIPIDRTQIQMTISSAPSGLAAFIVTSPRLKPGLSSHGPSGRNRLQSPTGSRAILKHAFGARLDFSSTIILPAGNGCVTCQYAWPFLGGGV